MQIAKDDYILETRSQDQIKQNYMFYSIASSKQQINLQNSLQNYLSQTLIVWREFMQFEHSHLLFILQYMMKVKRAQSIIKVSLGAILENDEQEKYTTELEIVKMSENYKQIKSLAVERNGFTKAFIYHYSEDQKCKLGQGSYGEVYRCYFEEVITRRIHKFAMKIILVPSSTSEVKKIEDIVATTRQEIKSLLKLRQNPNIIKIQDVIGDIKNNRIYLILQFCNNNDLPNYFKKLRKDGRLNTEEDVLFYFKQLINGFKDLYKHNIIHRDIKPDNILAHNNTLKIGDFGLSQQLFQKKQSLHDHRTIGTLLTSAPELIFKQPYTNKCDIYSLGLTLYWMLFQKFPFAQNSDLLDKKQLLSQSISMDNDSPIKVSAQLSQLIKHMVAFKESDRIQWQDLFNHPLFERIRDAEEIVRVRDSIGRGLINQSMSLTLQNIPSQFYNYIGQNSEFDLNVLLQGSQNKQKTQCFMKVFMEGVNFKFKVHFMKMLLRQIYSLDHSQKIKNKAQFAIIKDLLRLAIDNYIQYLNKIFKNQLNGLNQIGILDFRLLNEINTSKYFYFYVQRFNIQIQSYQNSHKKEKLSKNQKDMLQRNCEIYSIKDNFHLFFKKEDILVADQKEFMDQIKKCIVEFIYFIKEEVLFYADRQNSLPKVEQNRYRQLIILIHHLNMFIIQDKIFPLRYDSEINYDTEKFTDSQQFKNPGLFKKLARQVKEILARFEN